MTPCKDCTTKAACKKDGKCKKKVAKKSTKRTTRYA